MGAISVAAAIGCKMGIGDLFKGVEKARGAVKVALEAGSKLASGVTMAGIKTAELTANAAAEAAKLALAAPEAALKLATDTWNALQVAITSGLKFTAECLTALANGAAFVLAASA